MTDERLVRLHVWLEELQRRCAAATARLSERPTQEEREELRAVLQRIADEAKSVADEHRAIAAELVADASKEGESVSDPPHKPDDPCRHNNFVENRRDAKFKYGFCVDCKARLKKRLNESGQETGESYIPDAP